jgi:hypothetical protein
MGPVAVCCGHGAGGPQAPRGAGLEKGTAWYGAGRRGRARLFRYADVAKRRGGYGYASKGERSCGGCCAL